MKANKALLVLESPWFDIEENSGQASVYPFLHGLEKLESDFRVYHATFYDESSFEAALQHLGSADYSRAFLYVAAHGSSDDVASVPVDSLLSRINDLGNDIRLEGVILGACYAGVNVDLMMDCMRKSSITWMLGYRYSVDWLATMLIDLAVFREATKFRTQTLRSRNAIFARICSAIALFNGNAPVSEDEDEQLHLLRDSLTLVIQPKGRGYKPIDMSDLLSEIWGESSISEPREKDLGVLELLGRLWKKLGI